jgi:adenylate cyclase
MEPQSEVRRLTTILVADVVGYSRLMAADESGTLAQLIIHRKELIEPKAAEHHGRVVKLMGDGMLMEFGSVVDAVKFAVDIQKAAAERNADVSHESQIIYRIGINIGDIIVEGDDLYGDGVNVAARLEGLADPGGICIARNVFNQVKNKLDISFQDMGEQELKNIAEPMYAYRILMGENDVGPTAVDAAEALPLPDKPSIAVLPFDNMSGAPEQEYFVDGVTEDIITTLSKIPQLLVIARSSTFAYKGKSPDIRQVGRELGVRYVLEGSARHARDRVRVTAQLIDATTGHHLWAERYDRGLSDIFAVQDEITMEVVTALEVMLTRGEQARIWRKHAGNLEAYEYFQRGRDLYMMFNRRAHEQAVELLTRALEISPEFTGAMAYLGWAHHAQSYYGWSKLPEEGYQRAEQLAHRILEIEDTCGSGHALLASVHLNKGQHDAAIAEAEKAVALEPSSADLHHILAMTNGYAGRFDEAIRYEEQALRLSPLAPENSFTELARSYCHLGRADEAIQVLKRGLISRPRWITFRTLLVFAYVEAGKSDEAEKQAAKILSMNPKFSIRNWAKVHRYKDLAELERYMDALRRAGLPG